MRNLKLDTRLSFTDALLEGAKRICVDSENSVIYALNIENQIVAIQVENTQVQCKELTVIRELNEFTFAVGFVFLSDEQCLFLALSNGDLFRYDIPSSTSEIVGTVDSGLLNLSVSPEQDLILLITAQRTLILMSRSFDVICEKKIDVGDFGVGKPENVGWGSKETQFHGSEGKQAARVVKESVDPAAADDTGNINVTWKGDGSFFAISSIDPVKLCRKIRIWNRDGNLHYTSEDVKGLQDLIAWNPTGNLLVSSEKLPHKHSIIFFEKNGLKHGEFSLPKNETLKITRLDWSSDSKVLSIVGNSLSDSDSRTESLMLWTCSNYHWYLKYSIEYTNRKIIDLIWEDSNTLKLHVILSDGEYLQMVWSWEVDKAGDTVLVIDGPKLLWTAFEHHVVPPPMSTGVIEYEKPINSVTLTKSSSFVVQLNDGSFVDCKRVEIAGSDSQRVSFNWEYCVNYFKVDTTDSDSLHHFVLMNSCALVCVKSTAEGDALILCCAISTEHRSFVSKTLKKLRERVVSVTVMKEMVFMQLSDNGIYMYNVESDAFSPYLENGQPLKFAELCHKLDVSRVDETIYIFGISQNYCLFCNNFMLLQNHCTSFDLYGDDFIVITSVDHYIHCWSLTMGMDALSDKIKRAQYDEPRNIERGAKIICSIRADAKVVLQMPRGNLETIHPRTLLLHCLKKHLVDCEYQKLFNLMKKQRINLNLLVDHDRQLFLANIPDFIQKVGDNDVQDLCLFLSELSDENVCKTMYSYAYDASKHSELNGSSKVVAICTQFANFMTKLCPQKYLRPLLVAHIKRQDYVEVFKLVTGLVDVTERDKALRYLQYLVDENTLFNEALGTYDFNAVRMVAQRSNKDPKEYLSFIESYENVQPENYRCYKIDYYLKRFEKALLHLSRSEGEVYFQECLELVQKHHLFKQAVSLFDGEKSEKVWQLYGDYLLIKKYYEEAAIAFWKGKNYSRALTSYTLSNNWNGALQVIEMLDDREPLYVNLAENLVRNGKVEEASYVYEVYVKDAEKATKVLIEGHRWDHAMRMMNSNKMMKDHMLQYLLSHFDNLTETLELLQRDLNSYTLRFTEIRENKIRRACEVDEKADLESVDVFSDVSSERSTVDSSGNSGSLQTRRTNRNRRKQERRRFNLKEGNPFEYESLLFAIKEIITKYNDMQDEISMLIRTLYINDLTKQALSCKCAYEEFTRIVNASVKSVWSDEFTNVGGPGFTGNDLVTAELLRQQQKQLALDSQLLLAPTIRQTNWSLILLD